MYQILSKLLGFVEDITKTFGVFFRSQCSGIIHVHNFARNWQSSA